MTQEVEIILQSSAEPIKPKETRAQSPRGNQKPIKIFCADRAVAMALLEDLIVLTGAHRDVSNGKVPEDQVLKLAKNTQMFLIDLSDRLMVDSGLTEKDIQTIVEKLQRNTGARQKPRNQLEE